ncbi:MAG TPA: prepilin-type N-terminal cleavage/methylation domain-containing protein, partial [Thermoguttaceae bacterium]
MSRRLGFTLIEMVIVVGMSTVLAGMAVTILFALMKSHNIGREHLENSRTLNRLAIQFRRDVHATQEAGAVYKEGILELRLASQGGMTIRYQCLEERIDRLQLQGDKLISLESYMLPPDVDT